MEENIIKEQLKERIAGRKVKAALFMTFNFDPRFFENYVMPVLVPDRDFTNSEITNAVQWRRLYKEGKVPPITVYFDYDAKSRDGAPMLDYDWVAIHMPAVGKNKGNFHPKVTLVLVGGDPDELIVFIGSNNLTLGGWSDNREAVVDLVLRPGRFFPNGFSQLLTTMIQQTADLADRPLGPAENAIVAFLGRKGKSEDPNVGLFHSFQISFANYLELDILPTEAFDKVEIISPFLAKGTELVSRMMEKGTTVHLQLPMFGDSCTLDKALVKSYAEKGVQWHRPVDPTRNTHAKVYRFYGKKYVTTVIGSVNFTKPAWELLSSKTVSNVECAVAIREPNERAKSILGKKASVDDLEFLPPAPDAEDQFDRPDAPVLTFTLDWSNKLISWNGKSSNPCTVVLLKTLRFPLKGTERDLRDQPEDFFVALAKRSVVEVEERRPEGIRCHEYYLQQTNADQRPMPVRFSVSEIADYWDRLENTETELREWLISRLEQIEDLIQDESGKILSERTTGRSLLNDMARHFHMLVQLEKYLFKGEMAKWPDYRKQNHFREIDYYLIADNVETMTSYRKEIRIAYDRAEMLPSFYWLLLTVLNTQFFARERLMRFTRTMQKRNDFLEAAERVRREVTSETKRVESAITLDRRKLQWAASMLKEPYGAS